MVSKDWYVAYTFPKQERKVNRQLTQLGIETYLPFYETIRQWSDRRKKLEVPLFPNYIFVRTHSKKLAELLSVDGLSRFVAFGGTYATVRSEEIRAIDHLLRTGLTVQRESYPFKVGEEVEIGSGPLAGLRGCIMQRKGKARFILKVEGIKQALAIDLPRAYLKAAHI